MEAEKVCRPVARKSVSSINIKELMLQSIKNFYFDKVTLPRIISTIIDYRNDFLFEFNNKENR